MSCPCPRCGGDHVTRMSGPAYVPNECLCVGEAMSPLPVEWKDRSPGAFSGFCWVLGDNLAMVHKKVGEGSKWFVTCRRMAVSDASLVSVDAVEAQKEALRYLAKVLQDLNAKFGFLVTP